MTRITTMIEVPTCPAWCAADGHDPEVGAAYWHLTHEATVGNVGPARVIVQRFDQYEDGEGVRVGRAGVFVDPGDALLTAEEARGLGELLGRAAATLAATD